MTLSQTNTASGEGRCSSLTAGDFSEETKTYTHTHSHNTIMHYLGAVSNYFSMSNFHTHGWKIIKVKRKAFAISDIVLA